MSPLFNRNKKTTIAELEEYYANQRTNDSSARAWAMAVLSLLITIAVILALFFAGRWLWNVINDDDSATTTTTGQREGVTVRDDGTLSGDLSLLDNNSNNTQSGGTVSVDSGSTDDNTSESVVDNEDNDSEGVVSNEAATTDESNEDTVSATEENANSNEDINSTVETDGTELTPATELPNTGAGIILLAPVVAGAAGYTASISRKRR